MNFKLCLKCPKLEITSRGRIYCNASGGGVMGHKGHGDIFLDPGFEIPEGCCFVTEQMYKQEDAFEKFAEMMGPQAAQALMDDDPSWLEDL